MAPNAPVNDTLYQPPDAPPVSMPARPRGPHFFKIPWVSPDLGVPALRSDSRGHIHLPTISPTSPLASLDERVELGSWTWTVADLTAARRASITPAGGSPPVRSPSPTARPPAGRARWRGPGGRC